MKSAIKGPFLFKDIFLVQGGMRIHLYKGGVANHNHLYDLQLPGWMLHPTLNTQGLFTILFTW